MTNILVQLQTIQNERFAFPTNNSIAGARTYADTIREGLLLYEGASDTAEQEEILVYDGDRNAGKRESEADALKKKYASQVKDGVQHVVDELEDAVERGELQYGHYQFETNKNAVKDIWKNVSEADKILKTKTRNPVDKQITASTQNPKFAKSKAQTRFEEKTDW